MMKTLRFLFLASAVASVGCGDDGDGATLRKGQVDEDQLTPGVTVTISTGLGTVTVPFSEPVPVVPDGDFETEMSDSASLLVTSNQSGASADLMAGSIVDSGPSAPGEYSWELNADRDLATMRFFNETPGGLTLTPGLSYTAQLAVTTNDYIERVSAISFPIAVQ
jgi:hypothetical protein